MSVWQSYPTDYRADEVRLICTAAQAGECVAVVGLSGAGKSNLLGFLAQRVQAPALRFVLVDCNRVSEHSPAAAFRLMRQALVDTGSQFSFLNDLRDPLAALDQAISTWLRGTSGRLCFLLDRFDALNEQMVPALAGNLRALRDAYKYDLTYVTATRRPLDQGTELAELFFANTLWLGPLSASDARWNVTRYAARKALDWDDATIQRLNDLSWGYPALLRAACEAHAAGCALDPAALLQHPAVSQRVAEFWADEPNEAALRQARLLGQPLLLAGRAGVGSAGAGSETGSELTAKEHLLLVYFQAHSAQVCEKDDLIRAVWPEDRIFEKGIRDDSLAQLVRRLRTKIEADPSNPRRIQTIPGRGYRFVSA